MSGSALIFDCRCNNVALGLTHETYWCAFFFCLWKFVFNNSPCKDYLCSNSFRTHPMHTQCPIRCAHLAFTVIGWRKVFAHTRASGICISKWSTVNAGTFANGLLDTAPTLRSWRRTSGQVTQSLQLSLLAFVHLSWIVCTVIHHSFLCLQFNHGKETVFHTTLKATLHYS